MYFSTLAVLTAGLASSVSAFGKRADSTFPLYAYGTNIGGLVLQVSDGSAYIVAGNADVTGYSKVNFTSTSVDRTTKGTVSVASSSSEGSSDSILGQLLAVSPSANEPVALTTSPSTSQSTTEWSFLGAILLYQAKNSAFFAVPTGTDGVFQIQWLSDATSAPADSYPVTLKKTGPAKLADPALPGNPATAELRKRKV